MLSGASKHDLFFDLNLTHHVSDVAYLADVGGRRQQATISSGAHTGMAFKKRERSFSVDRGLLWKKKEDSGNTDFQENPIYVFTDPYEYYRTATTSGTVTEDNGDKTEYRGSRTFTLNAEEDAFEVDSDTFESRFYDASTGTWTDWEPSGSYGRNEFLTYSNAYTDTDAKAHVDSKLSSEVWSDWTDVAQMGISIIISDTVVGAKAEIDEVVSREEVEYQFFINTPVSLYTAVEWYEAEYNSYTNSTADSLKVSDGGQIIRGGFVSGSGDFEGLVGYINQLDNPDELGSRVRFSATVSDLTTGEYQHESNEYLLDVDEEFDLIARFRLTGEEVPLTMTPINRALSAPVTQGAFTFTAELVYVNCAVGQTVDFLKVGQDNLDFPGLGHYWKTQKMVLDVYFSVDGYEALVGWIPMTGARLSNPTILGYRTEAEPQGFSMNMEYQEFEAAGTSTLTPKRTNYACVKAVPTGGTRIEEVFEEFPSGYDPHDPETWNACESRVLSPSWPIDRTENGKDFENTAYAQVPTVDCTP